MIVVSFRLTQLTDKIKAQNPTRKTISILLANNETRDTYKLYYTTILLIKVFSSFSVYIANLNSFIKNLNLGAKIDTNSDTQIRKFIYLSAMKSLSRMLYRDRCAR